MGNDVPILVAQSGSLNGQRWSIMSQVIIGRGEDCDIVIPERQVSRHHARLLNTPEGTLLEDLSSKNGTYQNGNSIQEPVYLQDGDIIQIALAQSFYYISSDATLPLEQPHITPPTTSQSLRIDKKSRRIWIHDRELLPPISAPQYRLLERLYDNSDRIVTRSELIEAIWGEKEAILISEQALDALIRRLRERIAELDSNLEYIQTIRGHGLRLNNPPPY